MVTEIPGVDPLGRMSRKAAASLLGYHPGTLANWAVIGEGPPAHRDRAGKVFYKVDEVTAFALGDVGAAQPLAA